MGVLVESRNADVSALNSHILTNGMLISCSTLLLTAFSVKWPNDELCDPSQVSTSFRCIFRI